MRGNDLHRAADTTDGPVGRRISWDACVNVRDLGGLAARGGKVRPHRFVRASAFGTLSADGAQAMREFGVRTVIDLRWPEEMEARPSHFATGVRYVNIPVDRPREIDLYEALTTGTMREVVGSIAAPGSGVRDAIMTIAEAEPAVLVHCTAGLDRTGLIVALTLAAIDVQEDEIVADYCLSDAELEPEYRRLLSTEPDRYPSLPDRIRRREEMMRGLLTAVRGDYGNAASFLTAVGVSGMIVERLREALIESQS